MSRESEKIAVEILNVHGHVRRTLGEDTEWLARSRDLGVTELAVAEVLLERRIHERNASGYDLSSLGRDGRPGGTGEDADIGVGN